MNKSMVIFFVMLSLLVGIFVGYVLFDEDDNSCQEIRQVLYFEELEWEIADQATDIYDYYSLSSSAYDVSNYDMVVFYCEKSRDLSNTYSQGLRIIKAEYPEESNEILEVRKEMIETEIDYLFALYESCEYLESAGRAYDNGNWAMGDSAIEGQNTAIRRHDNLVEDYYNLDAKYNKLKRGLLE